MAWFCLLPEGGPQQETLFPYAFVSCKPRRKGLAPKDPVRVDVSGDAEPGTGTFAKHHPAAPTAEGFKDLPASTQLQSWGTKPFRQGGRSSRPESGSAAKRLKGRHLGHPMPRGLPPSLPGRAGLETTLTTTLFWSSPSKLGSSSAEVTLPKARPSA